MWGFCPNSAIRVFVARDFVIANFVDEDLVKDLSILYLCIVHLFNTAGLNNFQPK